MEQKAYGAVRVTDGREWIDLGSIDRLPEDVVTRVNDIRRRIPSWDDANPVRRVVEIRIVEVVST